MGRPIRIWGWNEAPEKYKRLFRDSPSDDYCFVALIPFGFCAGATGRHDVRCLVSSAGSLSRRGLWDGDEVSIEIEAIGILRNPVRQM